MYHRGMKWEEYLEHKGFKDDIVNGLERRTRDVVRGQKQAARQVVAAQQQIVREVGAMQRQAAREVAVAQRQAAREIAAAQAKTTHTLAQGFGRLVASQQEMNTVMRKGFGAVSYRLDRMAQSIESLRADFDWAMGAVLWKLEMQHHTLRNILAILQAPLDTQAKELRRRAEDAYLNGWYDEALIDFLESEKKNYQDFAVHQAIGNIYLYQRRPADLDKARAYYLKAGKYATPRSAYHAALAYLHAGFVCYLQGGDTAAIEHARRATELYPQLIEAFYNHAKFAAAAGLGDIAIPSLERAIRADRDYAVKARADADFERIEAVVTELMERLRAEARQKAEAQWQALQKEISRYAIAPQERRQIERAQAGFEAQMDRDTYFGYLGAPLWVAECRVAFNDLRLPERDKLQDEAARLLEHLRAEMADYIMPEAFQRQITDELVAAEQLLAGIPSYLHARTARDKADKCERLWKVAARGAVLKGHAGGVNAIAFSPRGTLLASASADQTVRLWDVASRRLHAVLKGHTRSVGVVAFSPDGATLASGSQMGGGFATVRLWDVATGRQRAMWRHSDVNAVAFSPDGATLASGSDDTVRLWDVASGRKRAVLKGHTGNVFAIAFSPDGATLASGSFDHTVRLWSVLSWRERAVLEGHTGGVCTIAFSPDGATLASGSSGWKGTDFTVRLWGMAMHKSEWGRMERERRERERRERERERKERKRRQQQRQDWRALGRCEECGAKLGFLDKLAGRTRCGKHR